ncbi:Bcr/CflA family multidrug efflux MFS transporter [Aquibaculum arenosum]|uniref:Bcr/CflA family efflux transporter n=1 Tax=Aquibaculum arenosum TaxID=3032591 RepID=A0ABT5YPG5_9PROT|nr:Bcr/CflA family multidrug efflux MFS transporter [Fodinicurvata sp. CAU 1616]MDF2096860.1 Bcr/CflA family multidrug efflux MFS transporter [Fodinicurvata sp. CAU 1616]
MTSATPAPASRRRAVELIIILGAMTAFAPLSIDMYLPAFPTLQEAFDTTAGRIQLTLSSFFIAFASGQMLYGPLADRFGRKKPALFGLGLFVLTSIGCAFAATVEQLMVLRFLQALGAGGGVVVARAMVRDLFPPSEAVSVFSRLMLVIGIAPMLAPLLGGYLLIWFDWQAIFYFLALCGLLCALAVQFRLKESLQPHMAQSLSPRAIAIAYGRLLADRRFIGPALVGGLSIAGMFVYITASPFVFIEVLGLSPETYGWVFGLNAFGFIAASQVNARLGRRFGPDGVLSVSNLVLALVGLALILGGALGIGGRYGVFLPIIGYITCLGFIMPNTAALAMAPFGRNAGSASALLGTLQFGLAAAASAIAGTFSHETPAALSLMVAGLGFCGTLAYFLLCRKARPVV